jgi:hypothetical protein
MMMIFISSIVVTIGVLPLKVRQWIRGVGDENKSDFGDDDI